MAPRSAREQLWRHRNGTPCELSADWEQCVACASSALEQACRFRCQPVSRHAAPKFSPEEDGSVRYATIKVPHEKTTKLREQGPLALATLWGSLEGSMHTTLDLAGPSKLSPRSRWVLEGTW